MSEGVARSMNNGGGVRFYWGVLCTGTYYDDLSVAITTLHMRFTRGASFRMRSSLFNAAVTSWILSTHPYSPPRLHKSHTPSALAITHTQPSSR
jgi:hypothetical protein